MLLGNDPEQGLAAYETLKRLAEDDSRKVSSAVRMSLARYAEAVQVEEESKGEYAPSEVVPAPREIDFQAGLPPRTGVAPRAGEMQAGVSEVPAPVPSKLQPRKGIKIPPWFGLFSMAPVATATQTSSVTPASDQTSVSTSIVTPSPTIIHSPTPLPAVITDDFDVSMVLVPAGSFDMGSSANEVLAACQDYFDKHFTDRVCDLSWFEDEEPLHTITLDDYFIDHHEVTNASYAKCVNAGDCSEPAKTSSITRESYYGDLQYKDYPVINVNREHAKMYCEWRGARLPTEAEWENTARGMDGRTYPWGNTFEGV